MTAPADLPAHAARIDELSVGVVITPMADPTVEDQAGETPRRRRRLVPVLPMTILLVFLGCAIFAPLITPHDPVKSDLTQFRRPPAWVDGGSTAHLLGTDGLGRDVFTRLLYGGRVSFTVAAAALLVAVIIGTTAGTVAGMIGGWIDGLLMRTVDMILSLPPIIVALTVAVAIGPSLRTIILVLGFLTWPEIARLIRAETLVLKNQDFVRYARAIGLPRRVVMIRHVVRNVVPTLLVVTTLQVGAVILSEASLSFIGAGVPAPSASWGAMISDGHALIATGWWIALFPGLAIAITVLCVNSLSDWLRDYLDPRKQPRDA